MGGGGTEKGRNLTSQFDHSNCSVRHHKHSDKTPSTLFDIRVLLQQTNQACRQNTTSKRRETWGKESPHLETFKYMLIVNLLFIVSK